MEGRSVETCPKEEKHEAPSVAKLAGRFNVQAATVAGKEVPVHKPTRRKPPCSLPLHTPKAESGQNGEEKTCEGSSHLPKFKVKSSPLIEKLQANLAFAPAALLPGGSPKSPGLKAAVSPFHSPPSTPSSPGIHARSSESDEGPVSFETPPEGTHLSCYNKVRTRGSVKRRPPSRRFRKSQSDIEAKEYLDAAAVVDEDGTRPEEGDEVFEERREKLKATEESRRANHRRTPEQTETGEKPSGDASSMLENSKDQGRPSQGTAKQQECEGSSELVMQDKEMNEANESAAMQELGQKPSKSPATVISKEPTTEQQPQAMEPNQELNAEQTPSQPECEEKSIQEAGD
ncbi:capZ-interacting protein [Rhinatrema bivittatum]|uniref:capZ-interacting protein n=1 Tax=Rhinatrema bivittatum TaxID=194408 RepID=UPI0011271A8E|nr:capZ-interacting protein [Rhinatrema bivittatum]